jgi:hypothetical protein
VSRSVVVIGALIITIGVALSDGVLQTESQSR